MIIELTPLKGILQISFGIFHHKFIFCSPNFEPFDWLETAMWFYTTKLTA